MKKHILIPVCCAALCFMLFAGCKPEDQIVQTAPPQTNVITPEVRVVQETIDARETLTVSGSGEVKLTPDTASLHIVIKTTETQADAAQQKNAELTDAVMASLKANDVKDVDIKTEDINLSEEYDYEKSPAKLVGYSMRNTLGVTVRDIAKVGTVITDAIAAGATSTYNLAFTVSDSSGAYQNALKAAVAEAQGKAAAMAEALGVGLAPIPVSVNEASNSYQPYAYDNFAPSAAAAVDEGMKDIAVSTGELSITAKVNIVYEILSATEPEPAS